MHFATLPPRRESESCDHYTLLRFPLTPARRSQNLGQRAQTLMLICHARPRFLTRTCPTMDPIWYPLKAGSAPESKRHKRQRRTTMWRRMSKSTASRRC